MTAPCAVPVMPERIGYVRLNNAAQRLADAANVAYWAEPAMVDFHHREAIAALQDAARVLGLRLEPAAAELVEVAA